MSAADRAGPDIRHVVLDFLPVSTIDATGLLTLLEVIDVLRGRGVSFNAAGRATEWHLWAEARGFDKRSVRLFPTPRSAVRELSSSFDPGTGVL